MATAANYMAKNRLAIIELAWASQETPKVLLMHSVQCEIGETVPACFPDSFLACNAAVVRWKISCGEPVATIVTSKPRLR